MPFDVDRRKFTNSMVASGVFTIVPRHVLGGAGYVPPSDKLTMAHIGMGTQGFNELGGLLANPEIQIVAVCDPNLESSDYVEWGKNSVRNRIRTLLGDPAWRENASGCPGGREIGRQVINAYYARERQAWKYQGCRAYADFRELFAKEKGIDVVKIMTPDHLHAPISIAAMNKGIHVLVHKPLSNRLYESRRVIETARKTKVVTHFLPYGSGDAMRLIVARINAGVIGKLREVHNWSARPMWPQYTEIPADRPPVPKGLDWDLWLGPEHDRPYHPHYTHAVFRGWYDFGGGSLADMGHYSLWPVFTGFNLGAPLSVQAWQTHYCSIVDQVSKRVKNDFSFPAACTIQFKYAARGDMPALDLFWYDGGMRPRVPEEMASEDKDLSPEGIMFIGDEGKIVAGFAGQNPQIYPKSKSDLLGISPVPPRGGSRRGTDQGRRELWLEAIKGGPPSPGAFPNAAALSDSVNLGAVALRTGRKILFDSENMKITNVPEANKYLFREYRKGWEL